MEGLRLLLLHHLRDPLSPQQMELLERHVAHLASYAEKLVNLLHRMRLKTQARLTLKDVGMGAGGLGLYSVCCAVALETTNVNVFWTLNPDSRQPLLGCSDYL